MLPCPTPTALPRSTARPHAPRCRLPPYTHRRPASSTTANAAPPVPASTCTPVSVQGLHLGVRYGRCGRTGAPLAACSQPDPGAPQPPASKRVLLLRRVQCRHLRRVLPEVCGARRQAHGEHSTHGCGRATGAARPQQQRCGRGAHLASRQRLSCPTHQPAIPPPPARACCCRSAILLWRAPSRAPRLTRTS